MSGDESPVATAATSDLTLCQLLILPSANVTVLTSNRLGEVG
jgi:hypothetical protein